MSGKYMKVRKIFIPTITMIIVASQLFGCSAASQDDALNMLNKSDGIEIEVADTDTDTSNNDQLQAEQERLAWTELGSLETNPDLRSAIDTIFKVSGETGSKQGIIYETPDSSEGETYTYDNNNTLDVAIHNYNFREQFDASQTEIADAARSSYIDLDDETDDVAVTAAINSYFNLLPDTDDGNANPNDTLTRAEVMAAIMRAITPVSDSLSSDEAFNAAVGSNEYKAYNDYAKELDASAFISTKDGSLDATTYAGKMTRGEAIYLLMSKFFPEKLAEDNIAAYPGYTFTDCTTSETYEGTVATNAEALQKMLSDNKADKRIYNAMVLAAYLGIIDADTESGWNLSVTRSEFIDLLYKALLNETTTMSRFNAPSETADLTEAEIHDYEMGNKTTPGTINGYENPELIPQPEEYGKTIKSLDDIPNVDSRGWDYEKHPVYHGYTTKGYMCVVDGLTNKTFYANMQDPTGSFFGGDKETTVMSDYIDAKGYDNYAEITYEEAKELFGEADPSTYVDLEAGGDENWR